MRHLGSMINHRRKSCQSSILCHENLEPRTATAVRPRATAREKFLSELVVDLALPIGFPIMGRKLLDLLATAQLPLTSHGFSK